MWKTTVAISCKDKQKITASVEQTAGHKYYNKYLKKKQEKNDL